MPKIINELDVIDQVVFKLVKKDSIRLKIGQFINIKTKLDLERIQEIFEYKNDVYITQHHVQYIIKKTSLKQVLLPLITGKNLKIKFDVEKIRFFCSNCGGVGGLDWIRSVKKVERFQGFYGKCEINSTHFNVYSNYYSDLMIKGSILIEKDDLHTNRICEKCKGSGIEPTPGEKLIDNGTLRQIYFKYLEKASD